MLSDVMSRGVRRQGTWCASSGHVVCDVRARGRLLLPYESESWHVMMWHNILLLPRLIHITCCNMTTYTVAVTTAITWSADCYHDNMTLDRVVCGLLPWQHDAWPHGLQIVTMTTWSVVCCIEIIRDLGDQDIMSTTYYYTYLSGKLSMCPFSSKTPRCFLCSDLVCLSGLNLCFCIVNLIIFEPAKLTAEHNF